MDGADDSEFRMKQFEFQHAFDVKAKLIVARPRGNKNVGHVHAWILVKSERMEAAEAARCNVQEP